VFVPQIAPFQNRGGRTKLVESETFLVKAGTIARGLEAFAHLYDTLRLRDHNARKA
jgi:hypothetical protein